MRCIGREVMLNPVFSLVMDRDIKDKVALDFPELYKDLAKGRSLSYKTFFIWFLISIYQGATTTSKTQPLSLDVLN